MSQIVFYFTLSIDSLFGCPVFCKFGDHLNENASHPILTATSNYHQNLIPLTCPLLLSIKLSMPSVII